MRIGVVKRSSKEFELLAKRWVIERTFGWLNRYRRLNKDCELYTEISEAMIYGVLIRIMLSRIIVVSNKAETLNATVRTDNFIKRRVNRSVHSSSFQGTKVMLNII
ncbi:transposase [Synechocystis sp. PCC 6803]|nr:transposase [Synechocystis sp. PCC 6803]